MDYWRLSDAACARMAREKVVRERGGRPDDWQITLERPTSGLYRWASAARSSGNVTERRSVMLTSEDADRAAAIGPH